jgi:hypothetical protein
MDLKRDGMLASFQLQKRENDNRIAHKASLFATGISNWKLNFEK